MFIEILSFFDRMGEKIFKSKQKSSELLSSVLKNVALECHGNDSEVIDNGYSYLNFNENVPLLTLIGS